MRRLISINNIFMAKWQPKTSFYLSFSHDDDDDDDDDRRCTDSERGKNSEYQLVN